MTDASRTRLLALALVILYALFLWVVCGYLTVFDDEAAIISVAQRDPSEMMAAFLAGGRQHEHPPLFDMLFHLWLEVSGNDLRLMRLPSVLFYCAGLWLCGAAAEVLWGRRVLGVLVGMAWPLGLFFGTPVHWSSLAFMTIAGATWGYFLWLRKERTAGLVAFTLFGIALVYTNYLGWAFLGTLGLHFLLTRPSRAALLRATAAGLAVFVAFLPILRSLLAQLEHGTRAHTLSFALANAGYQAYSLIVSETIAPWHWPAAVAAVGILTLAYVSLRTPSVLWVAGLLAVVYLSCVAIGILNARRLLMFGPWLILFFTGLIANTRFRRTAVAGLILAFGVGWAGAASGRWYATHRHTEPWDEVASDVLKIAKPGALVIAGHPSFYFYAQQHLGVWEDFNDVLPEGVVERSGLVLSQIEDSREAIAGKPQVLYVRTSPNPELLEKERRLEASLAQGFRQTHHSRYVEDTASAFKSRFVANQGRWRIEVRAYERDEGTPRR